MSFDYSRLRGKIVEKFGSQVAFASAIKMSTNSLSNKLVGKRAFTQDEIEAICDALDVPVMEIGNYFFTR